MDVEWLKALWGRILAALRDAGTAEIEERVKAHIREVLDPIARDGLPPEQEQELKAWLKDRTGPAAHMLTEISDELVRLIGKLALDTALAAAEGIHRD
jgi:hypothetical protein